MNPTINVHKTHILRDEHLFFPTSPSETLLTSKGPSRPASNEVYHLQIGIHQQKNGCHKKEMGLEQQQEVGLLWFTKKSLDLSNT